MRKLILSVFQRSFTTRDILLLAFALLIINVIIVLIHTVNGEGYPYNSFLFDPADRFADFFKVMDGLFVADTWPGEHANFVYYEHVLPMTATYLFVSAKLIAFTGNKYLVFCTLYLLIFSVIVLISRKKNNPPLIILLSLVSYPVIFAVDRGNIAILVFLMLLIAVTTDSVMLATFCIAIATSIKLTPLIFLAPILLKKPVSFNSISKIMLMFLAWLMSVNFLSIQINGHFLTPHVYDPVLLFTRPLEDYSYKYIEQMAGLGYGSSLYMAALHYASRLQLSKEFLAMVKPLGLCLAIFGVIGVLVLLKRRIISTFNDVIIPARMLFITCISFVLLMPVTGDYYLLVMLIPILAFPGMYYTFGYFILYGSLLGAKNFYYIDHVHYTNITPQVYINPICLLIMLIAEFKLIGFIQRDTKPLQRGGHVAAALDFLKIHRKKIAVTVVTLIVLIAPPAIYYREKTITQNRIFASDFAHWEWYYSTDGGVTWPDRAEGGLEKFDKQGRPVHVLGLWGTGEWINSNTINWVAETGSRAVWRGIPTQRHDKEYVEKATAYVSKFKTKKWFVTSDSGSFWFANADANLKEFDSLGNPIHKDPFWGIGDWQNENTIHWFARSGAESMWKSNIFESEFSKTDLSRWKRYASSFTHKTWYYSSDGVNFVDRAESGLKEFDENGNPIHASDAWSIGKWVDENTIHWKAINDTKSIWKALSEPSK